MCYIECKDTDVRLVQISGDMGNEGQIEYCSSGQWGLVCSDSWDSSDAKMICHQLGYNVGSKFNTTALNCGCILCIYHNIYIQHTDLNAVAIYTRVGIDPLPTFLQRVDCIGSEESISQCPQDNSGECLNTGAGVICPLQINYGSSDTVISLFHIR